MYSQGNEQVLAQKKKKFYKHTYPKMVRTCIGE